MVRLLHCENPPNDPARAATAQSEENPSIHRKPRGKREEIGQIPLSFLLICCQLHDFPVISSSALRWQELGESGGFSHSALLKLIATHGARRGRRAVRYRKLHWLAVRCSILGR